MVTFALITEGITDQVILDYVICKYYSAISDTENEIEVHTNPIQPARDETDISRSASMGGWENVFEHCANEETIKNCLATNDFVVIQVDTDCCEHKNFGVPLTSGGADRGFEELIEDTIEVIAGKIGKNKFEENKDRFIFAISVHSLECWALQFLLNHKRTKNCEKHLRIELGKKGFALKKEYDCYREIAKSIKGKDLVAAAGERQDSFGFFLASLPVIGPQS